jgi:tetratricopeptide (TPR) repeat protein
MARFDKLELGTKPNAAPQTEQAHSPLDEIGWLKKADGHRRRGEFETALRLFSRALELDKSLLEGWLGQVQMLVLLDELKESELWARKALELFPNNGELLAARAQALCRLGDLKQAHVVSDGALKQPGQSAYRWIIRGELMLAGGQDVDRHCFEKARQISADWLVPLEIALVCLYYNRPSRALDSARQAVEKAADQCYAWYVQGLCESELGLARPALRSLSRCRELSPGNVEAERLVAKVENGGIPIWRALRRLFHW